LNNSISINSRHYIPEFDGVRAIAVSLVLLNHGYFGWREPTEPLQESPWLIFEIINHGWLGVDLFFVLSGLLITGVLLDSNKGQNYFRNFYIRRALRILPIYLICIMVMALFYTEYRDYFLISIPFLSNFATAFDIPKPHGPSVFWSLSVEEHFYLLWPILVLKLSQRNLCVLAMSIVIATPLLRAVAVAKGMSINAEIYTYSIFRFDGLATGCLLALWIRNPGASVKNSLWLVVGIVTTLISITLLTLPFDVMTQSVAGVALRFTQANLIFATFLMLVLLTRGSYLTSPLRTRAAVYIGKLSYCIYLIHLSIGDALVAVTAPYFEEMLFTLGAFGLATLRLLLMTLVSIIIAALSMRFIEGPALRYKNKFN